MEMIKVKKRKRKLKTFTNQDKVQILLKIAFLSTTYPAPKVCYK
ncbi:hypothetical protein SAMN04488541_10684 [Thermoflexibacter ruber]|uniref:Uncharacterized protein n=1 Tax=Thermoflexibacter ruber TaxID=1003 RepID=A0A1I2JVY6_9BACT|nr:hypothetical protein SAMN04488541_10684 [Thermoflexibacter ruber]